MQVGGLQCGAVFVGANWIEVFALPLGAGSEANLASLMGAQIGI
jgi:hypothetical protein